MNLYLVSRTDESNWNQDRQAVVAAESEDAARNVMPENKWEWVPKDKFHTLKVKLLGVSASDKAGIILVKSTGS